MKPWISYDPATGEILMGGDAPDVESLSEIPNVIFDSPIGYSQAHYIDTATRQPVEIPAQPTDKHVWDWATHSWVVDVAALATDLATQVYALRTSKTFAPVTYGGNPFDADPEAREAIYQTYASLARGEGLPAGWIGWRDANNTFHWEDDLAPAVQSHLQNIMKLVIDRHQALIKVNWTHADTIRQKAEANDVAGLMSYDITSGWP